MKKQLFVLASLTLLMTAAISCGRNSRPATTGAVVPAPVESVEIERLAAKPPNATMIVVSGLPRSCDSFNGYSLTRDGDRFNLEVTNLRQGEDCPETYTTVRTDIPLGEPTYSDIEPCRTYSVMVSGEERLVESSCPAMDSGQWTNDSPCCSYIR